VSGCKYIIDYDPPEWQGTWGGAIHKGACRRHSGDCKCNPNCYYKQLKQAEQRIVEVNKTIQSKEQECEELKEKINNLLCSENCYKYKQADQYKQALKEIQEIAENCSFTDNIKLLLNRFEQILEKCEVIDER